MRFKLRVTDIEEHELMEAHTKKRCAACTRNNGQQGILASTAEISAGEIFISVWTKPDAKVVKLASEGNEQAKEQVKKSQIRRIPFHVDCYREKFGIDDRIVSIMLRHFEYSMQDEDVVEADISKGARKLSTLPEVIARLNNDKLTGKVSEEIAKSILSKALKGSLTDMGIK